MNAVTIHRDHLEVLKDYSNEDIGKLVRSLMTDVLEERDDIDLAPDLQIIKKYIQNQNNRFSKQQSEKRKSPKKPIEPNNPKLPTQPSVPVSVPVSVSVSDTVSYVDNIPDGISSTTVSETGKKESPIGDSKKQHGEFQKVKLTDGEYSKLVERLGERSLNDYIERLDGWLAEGHAKKNHYATILNWWRKDGSKPPDDANEEESEESEYLRDWRELAGLKPGEEPKLIPFDYSSILGNSKEEFCNSG